MKLSATGPTMTISTAGKMNSTSGNRIFCDARAPACSARWNR
jgi:hypothetical protein